MLELLARMQATTKVSTCDCSYPLVTILSVLGEDRLLDATLRDVEDILAEIEDGAGRRRGRGSGSSGNANAP